jgi:hypothetical protein
MADDFKDHVELRRINPTTLTKCKDACSALAVSVREFKGEEELKNHLEEKRQRAAVTREIRPKPVNRYFCVFKFTSGAGRVAPPREKQRDPLHRDFFRSDRFDYLVHLTEISIKEIASVCPA